MRLVGLMIDPGRICLVDPTGTIERECEMPEIRQKDVALTYALAIRDEDVAPVDWARANAAIRRRWPKGLVRVKTMAWAHFRTRAAHPLPEESK